MILDPKMSHPRNSGSTLTILLLKEVGQSYVNGFLAENSFLQKIDHFGLENEASSSLS